MSTESVPGMITLEQLRDLASTGEIETVVTVFSDLYGRLMGKRIAVEFFLEHIASAGMHACNYLYTVDMEMDPVPGYSYASWELGYGDFHCVPALDTLRRATWLEKSALVICDALDEHNGAPVAVDPRNILKGQLRAAADMRFRPKGSSELEYFIFDSSYREARAAHYQDLKPFGAYIEDYHILQGTREEVLNGAARKHLAASGVPVEFSKGEWGPGQHELNIRYADLLTMADRHSLYKQCLKDIAGELGLSVTFMAKFDADLAGSSCHMHVSLWDIAEDRSLFAGDSQFGPVRASDEFRWFLGGWIAHARELMPFYAPTINSYKRYQSGSWAPTALAWSYDNRTAGFRVVGHGESLRIESRLAGADVNPYLAYAAVVASGLDGIREKIEPPEIFTGDVYAAAHLPQVPRTLRAAVDSLQDSAFARRAFGDSVVEHYLHFFHTELEKFDGAVTDWERRRYFEQI